MILVTLHRFLIQSLDIESQEESAGGGVADAGARAVEGAREFVTELSWIDTVGLGIVAVFLVLGFMRGLWWQIIRLAGLVGAVLIARALSQRWEPALLQKFPELDPRLAEGILWLGIFLAGLALAALVGKLGKKMLAALQLSFVDRTGGAIAGVATGLILHCAVLAGLVQLGTREFVSDTLVGSYSEDLLEIVGQRYPVVVDAKEGSAINSLLQWDLRGR